MKYLRPMEGLVGAGFGDLLQLYYKLKGGIFGFGEGGCGQGLINVTETPQVVCLVCSEGRGGCGWS